MYKQQEAEAKQADASRHEADAAARKGELERLQEQRATLVSERRALFREEGQLATYAWCCCMWTQAFRMFLVVFQAMFNVLQMQSFYYVGVDSFPRSKNSEVPISD